MQAHQMKQNILAAIVANVQVGIFEQVLLEVRIVFLECHVEKRIPAFGMKQIYIGTKRQKCFDYIVLFGVQGDLKNESGQISKHGIESRVAIAKVGHIRIEGIVFLLQYFAHAVRVQREYRMHKVVGQTAPAQYLINVGRAILVLPTQTGKFNEIYMISFAIYFYPGFNQQQKSQYFILETLNLKFEPFIKRYVVSLSDFSMTDQIEGECARYMHSNLSM